MVDVEKGEIIGINTCIRANVEGTSFAVPINKAHATVHDLAEGKHVSHGYVGKKMFVPFSDYSMSCIQTMSQFFVYSQVFQWHH